ncbi:MAG: ferric enterobactin receptor [Saprospiraceae bacterium]|jgi:ferric enterobactin receptor
MNKILSLCFLIGMTWNLKGQVSYCAVFGEYDNLPLTEVLSKIESWCKIKIIYKEETIRNISVSKNFDGTPFKKAINEILEDTPLGFVIIDDQAIELKEKASLIKYISISNDFKNVALSKVFDIWAFNYKINIDYDYNDLLGINVNGKLKDDPMDVAFSKILSNTDLSYEIMGPKIVKVYRPKGDKKEKKVYDSISQNVTLSGSIKDRVTGETLPFANVLVQGTTTGTSANVDGFFSLFNVPSDTALLEVSYMGYLSDLVRLNPDMNIENFELTLDPGGVHLDEITIAAVNADEMMKASSGVSKIGLTPEIASILPSYGEKDIFRSLQLLPGVSGTNESSSGLVVRGGTPDQNLILFDGFTVYHVDHLFGFFSAFNANAIKDVQLYKGGFEAKYGGRLSSVVDITGKDGNTNEFNMGIGASLLSVNGFVESPFANGKGSFIVTGRRSFQSNFYSNIFDSFTDIGGGSEDQPAPTGGGIFGGRGGFGGFGQAQVQPNSYFYDLNAKLTYRFSPKDKVSFSLYNGVDDLDNSRITDSNAFTGGRFGGENATTSFVNDNIDLSNWGNLGGSAKWSRQWSDKFYSNTTLSYSNYYSERDQNSETNITRADTIIVRRTGSYENNDLTDLTFKIDNEYKINQNNQLGFGLQYTYNDIKYDYNQNDTITLVNRDDQGLTASFYIQDRITINDKLILSAGLRTNYYGPTSKLYLEPRASATFLVNEKFKLKGAFGKYNQYATRVVREDIQQGSRDFWILADDTTIPTSSSTHFILGASYETNGILFDVEAYHKNYDGLSEYTNRLETSGFGPNQSLSIDERFYTGSGYSRGLEFLVQKKHNKFTGWVSYTLGEVKYDFDDFGDKSFFANQDERHEFKIVGSYRLKNFDLSSTFVYGSGKPYTAPLGFYELTLLDGSTEPYFEISEKNILRNPAYHRLDLSANYNFNIGESKVKIGVSVFNVYNRNNTWYKEYEVIESQLLETDVSLLGLTPSLFFNWTLK